MTGADVVLVDVNRASAASSVLFCSLSSRCTDDACALQAFEYKIENR